MQKLIPSEMILGKVAEFEKVSFVQFYEEVQYSFSNSKARCIYDNIKLPERATKGSCGYDICAPFDFTLRPNEVITIPTGIRARIDEGYFLMCAPRSGQGFKCFSTLANTVGVIDSDYYQSDNEGHIFVKLINRSPISFFDKFTKKGRKKIKKHTMRIEQGQGCVQAILLPFGRANDSSILNERNGGFGSTDK